MGFLDTLKKQAEQKNKPAEQPAPTGAVDFIVEGYDDVPTVPSKEKIQTTAPVVVPKDDFVVEGIDDVAPTQDPAPTLKLPVSWIPTAGTPEKIAGNIEKMRTYSDGTPVPNAVTDYVLEYSGGKDQWNDSIKKAAIVDRLKEDGIAAPEFFGIPAAKKMSKMNWAVRRLQPRSTMSTQEALDIANLRAQGIEDLQRIRAPQSVIEDWVKYTRSVYDNTADNLTNMVKALPEIPIGLVQWAGEGLPAAYAGGAYQTDSQSLLEQVERERRGAFSNLRKASLIGDDASVESAQKAFVEASKKKEDAEKFLAQAGAEKADADILAGLGAVGEKAAKDAARLGIEIGKSYYDTAAAPLSLVGIDLPASDPNYVGNNPFDALLNLPELKAAGKIAAAVPVAATRAAKGANFLEEARKVSGVGREAKAVKDALQSAPDDRTTVDRAKSAASNFLLRDQSKPAAKFTQALIDPNAGTAIVNRTQDLAKEKDLAKEVVQPQLAEALRAAHGLLDTAEGRAALDSLHKMDVQMAPVLEGLGQTVNLADLASVFDQAVSKNKKIPKTPKSTLEDAIAEKVGTSFTDWANAHGLDVETIQRSGIAKALGEAERKGAIDLPMYEQGRKLVAEAQQEVGAKTDKIDMGIIFDEPPSVKPLSWGQWRDQTLSVDRVLPWVGGDVAAASDFVGIAKDPMRGGFAAAVADAKANKIFDEKRFAADVPEMLRQFENDTAQPAPVSKTIKVKEPKAPEPPPPKPPVFAEERAKVLTDAYLSSLGFTPELIAEAKKNLRGALQKGMQTNIIQPAAEAAINQKLNDVAANIRAAKGTAPDSLYSGGIDPAVKATTLGDWLTNNYQTVANTLKKHGVDPRLADEFGMTAAVDSAVKNKSLVDEDGLRSSMQSWVDAYKKEQGITDPPPPPPPAAKVDFAELRRQEMTPERLQSLGLDDAEIAIAQKQSLREAIRTAIRRGMTAEQATKIQDALLDINKRADKKVAPKAVLAGALEQQAPKPTWQKYVDDNADLIEQILTDHGVDVNIASKSSIADAVENARKRGTLVREDLLIEKINGLLNQFQADNGLLPPPKPPAPPKPIPQDFVTARAAVVQPWLEQNGLPKTGDLTAIVQQGLREGKITQQQFKELSDQIGAVAKSVKATGGNVPKNLLTGLIEKADKKPPTWIEYRNEKLAALGRDELIDMGINPNIAEAVGLDTAREVAIRDGTLVKDGDAFVFDDLVRGLKTEFDAVYGKPPEAPEAPQPKAPEWKKVRSELRDSIISSFALDPAIADRSLRTAVNKANLPLAQVDLLIQTLFDAAAAQNIKVKPSDLMKGGLDISQAADPLSVWESIKALPEEERLQALFDEDITPAELWEQYARKELDAAADKLPESDKQMVEIMGMPYAYTYNDSIKQAVNAAFDKFTQETGLDVTARPSPKIADLQQAADTGLLKPTEIRREVLEGFVSGDATGKYRDILFANKTVAEMQQMINAVREKTQGKIKTKDLFTGDRKGAAVPPKAQTFSAYLSEQPFPEGLKKYEDIAASIGLRTLMESLIKEAKAADPARAGELKADIIALQSWAADAAERFTAAGGKLDDEARMQARKAIPATPPVFEMTPWRQAQNPWVELTPWDGRSKKPHATIPEWTMFRNYMLQGRIDKFGLNPAAESVGIARADLLYDPLIQQSQREGLVAAFDAYMNKIMEAYKAVGGTINPQAALIGQYKYDTKLSLPKPSNGSLWLSHVLRDPKVAAFLLKDTPIGEFPSNMPIKDFVEKYYKDKKFDKQKKYLEALVSQAQSLEPRPAFGKVDDLSASNPAKRADNFVSTSQAAIAKNAAEAETGLFRNAERLKLPEDPEVAIAEDAVEAAAREAMKQKAQQKIVGGVKWTPPEPPKAEVVKPVKDPFDVLVAGKISPEPAPPKEPKAKAPPKLKGGAVRINLPEVEDVVLVDDVVTPPPIVVPELKSTKASPPKVEKPKPPPLPDTNPFSPANLAAKGIDLKIAANDGIRAAINKAEAEGKLSGEQRARLIDQLRQKEDQLLVDAILDGEYKSLTQSAPPVRPPKGEKVKSEKPPKEAKPPSAKAEALAYFAGALDNAALQDAGLDPTIVKTLGFQQAVISALDNASLQYDKLQNLAAKALKQAVDAGVPVSDKLKSLAGVAVEKVNPDGTKTVKPPSQKRLAEDSVAAIELARIADEANVLFTDANGIPLTHPLYLTGVKAMPKATDIKIKLQNGFDLPAAEQEKLLTLKRFVNETIERSKQTAAARENRWQINQQLAINLPSRQSSERWWQQHHSRTPRTEKELLEGVFGYASQRAAEELFGALKTKLQPDKAPADLWDAKNPDSWGHGNDILTPQEYMQITDPKIRERYMQMPTGAEGSQFSYGVLSGQYLPATIGNALVNQYKRTDGWWKTFVQDFKGNNTGLSPVFWANQGAFNKVILPLLTADLRLTGNLTAPTEAINAAADFIKNKRDLDITKTPDLVAGAMLANSVLSERVLGGTTKSLSGLGDSAAVAVKDTVASVKETPHKLYKSPLLLRDAYRAGIDLLSDAVSLSDTLRNMDNDSRARLFQLKLEQNLQRFKDPQTGKALTLEDVKNSIAKGEITAEEFYRSPVVENAAGYVNKYHFDYARNTPYIIDAIDVNGLLPFFRYAWHSSGLLFDLMDKNNINAKVMRNQQEERRQKEDVDTRRGITSRMDIRVPDLVRLSNEAFDNIETPQSSAPRTSSLGVVVPFSDNESLDLSQATGLIPPETLYSYKQTLKPADALERRVYGVTEPFTQNIADAMLNKIGGPLQVAVNTAQAYNAQKDTTENRGADTLGNIASIVVPRIIRSGIDVAKAEETGTGRTEFEAIRPRIRKILQQLGVKIVQNDAQQAGRDASAALGQFNKFMNQKMDRELTSLDPSDPMYKDKESRIRKKYEMMQEIAKAESAVLSAPVINK